MQNRNTKIKKNNMLEILKPWGALVVSVSLHSVSETLSVVSLSLTCIYTLYKIINENKNNNEN